MPRQHHVRRRSSTPGQLPRAKQSEARFGQRWPRNAAAPSRRAVSRPRPAATTTARRNDDRQHGQWRSRTRRRPGDTRRGAARPAPSRRRRPGRPGPRCVRGRPRVRRGRVTRARPCAPRGAHRRARRRAAPRSGTVPGSSRRRPGQRQPDAQPAGHQAPAPGAEHRGRAGRGRKRPGEPGVDPAQRRPGAPVPQPPTTAMRMPAPRSYTQPAPDGTARHALATSAGRPGSASRSLWCTTTRSSPASHAPRRRQQVVDALARRGRAAAYRLRRPSPEATPRSAACRPHRAATGWHATCTVAPRQSEGLEAASTASGPRNRRPLSSRRW